MSGFENGHRTELCFGRELRDIGAQQWQSAGTHTGSGMRGLELGAGQEQQSQAGIWPTGSGSSDQLSKMPRIKIPREDFGAGNLVME